MNGHLGTWVSALADGQLTPAVTERALIHVAGCPQCAAELADARRSRRMIAAVQDVRPDGDLTARLLALGCGGSSRTVPREPAEVPFRSGGMAPALGGNGALTGELTPTRRGLRAVIGSVTGLGVVAAGLFLLGDRPTVAPASQPSAVNFAWGEAGRPVASAISTAGMSPSTQDYLSWMREHGWSCPTSVPDGWVVTSVRLRDDGETLEVYLSGPSGRVLVTEQHGQLDVDALVGAFQLTVADRTIYRIPDTLWHVAWQSGDTVIEVVSEDSVSRPEVVESFPVTSFDSGVSARLGRGWTTLTSGFFSP